MSKDFCIKIADCLFNISPMYDYSRELCRGYICDSSSDSHSHIKISKEDIDFEKKKCEKESQLKGIETPHYGDDYFESLAICRKISHKLIDYDTLLFHGSALELDGEAYLFIAKSGTGKSTHARLWREHFGNRVTMINDDKPFLKITEKGVTVYGSPWNGKHRLDNNISAPLRAIAILEQDTDNHILRIDKRSALPMLYQQSFRPNERGLLSKSMSLIDRLGDNVALYKLGCNMEPDAASVSYRGMNS